MTQTEAKLELGASCRCAGPNRQVEWKATEKTKRTQKEERVAAAGRRAACAEQRQWVLSVCLCARRAAFCIDHAVHNAEVSEQYLTKQPRWSSDVIKALHQGVLLLGAGSRSFLLLFLPLHRPPTESPKHIFRKQALTVRSNAIRTYSEFHFNSVQMRFATLRVEAFGWKWKLCWSVLKGKKKKRREMLHFDVGVMQEEKKRHQWWQMNRIVSLSFLWGCGRSPSPPLHWTRLTLSGK